MIPETTDHNAKLIVATRETAFRFTDAAAWIERNYWDVSGIAKFEPIDAAEFVLNPEDAPAGTLAVGEEGAWYLCAFAGSRASGRYWFAINPVSAQRSQGRLVTFRRWRLIYRDQAGQSHIFLEHTAK